MEKMYVVYATVSVSNIETKNVNLTSIVSKDEGMRVISGLIDAVAFSKKNNYLNEIFKTAPLLKPISMGNSLGEYIHTWYDAMLRGITLSSVDISNMPDLQGGEVYKVALLDRNNFTVVNTVVPATPVEPVEPIDPA